MKERIKDLNDAKKRWEENHITEKGIEIEPVTNSTGIPIKLLYTPADVNHKSYIEDIGFPGEYPFTRGIHPTMYRTHPWTMRMYSGFGTPEETNQRFKFLMNQGQTGLSLAMDLPTQCG